jgi:hypothetical protein
MQKFSLQFNEVAVMKAMAGIYLIHFIFILYFILQQEVRTLPSSISVEHTTDLNLCAWNY